MKKQKSGSWKSAAYHTCIMLLLLGITSGIGYVFRHIGFHDTNIVVIYLLSVLIIVWLTNGFIYGFIASIMATFMFNYLFAEPYFAFAVNDPDYTITFIIMTFTAFIASTLTSHSRRSATAALERETETKAIYNLTNRLSDAQKIHDIADIAVCSISKFFSCDIAFLIYDENGKPEKTFFSPVSGDEKSDRQKRNFTSPGLASPESLKLKLRKPKKNGIYEDSPEIKLQMEGLKSGFTTGKIDEKYLDWPITGRDRTIGIISLPIKIVETMNEAQMRLLRSMIENIALAMDRLRSVEQRIKSQEEIIKERYRANLLQAISHDIRTPIAGIAGTSEMIIGMTKPDDPCHGLAREIQKDADWLHSLVENILNLTRLQDGKLILQKKLEAAEEVIGEAIRHISKHAPEYEITACVPNDLLFVPMDAKLIVQVIINLLDNAVKHTEPDKDISISVELNKENKMAFFTIQDSGSGVDENDLPNIFKMFYTKDVGCVKSRNGVGLGLVICETIIKAHGGSIEARNRLDGPGLEIVFSLPMEDSGE